MFALETTILVNFSISFSYLHKNKLEIIIIIINKKKMKNQNSGMIFLSALFLNSCKNDKCNKGSAHEEQPTQWKKQCSCYVIWFALPPVCPLYLLGVGRVCNEHANTKNI